MPYRYDPELAAAAAAAPVFDVRSPADARAVLAALGNAVPPFRFPASVTHASELVSVGNGAIVEVHVVRRAGPSGQEPVLVWFHGGGFVFGTSSMDAALYARMVDDLGVVVVSVEYSLAPEHPYPTAVEEGFAVLEWVERRAADLGIDPQRVAIGGHSAGGCLAAAVALMTRDRRGPALCLQVLDLPVTDDRLETVSMRAYLDTPIWHRDAAEASWRAYLAGSTEDGRAYAAPLRTPDLRSLPPAYVSVAEFDPLRDEGIAYAQRLVQAGVPTELHLFPGTFHGSAAAAPEAEVTRSMVGHLLDALRRGFATRSVAPTGAMTSAASA